jgi:MFS transporter, putative metabolite:H+ symporter
VLQLLAPEFRKRTILMWIVSLGFFWSSNGILFMLPTILTQRGFSLAEAITFQLVQSIAAIFGYSICSFLVDRYGRRPVIFLYYLVGAFFHLWFALAGGLGMYAAIAAVGWVNPGAFGPSIVYAGELYPTHLRATGVGWFFGIGRIASFIAPTVVGLMLAGGLGQYVLHTFALSYLVAAAGLLAVGIETRGLILEKVGETSDFVEEKSGGVAAREPMHSGRTQ